MPLPKQRKPTSRSYDAESRKPRVTTRKMFKRQPPPEPIESSSDNHISSDSDSEMEKDLEIENKDDTRNKTLRSKVIRKRETKDTATQDALHSQVESNDPEKSISAAPHMIMRSSVYHLQAAPIVYPKVSTFVPSFYMFFFALHAMHTIVHENTYLHYLTPNYITIASSLYYSILGYIQILRAKVVAGIITKVEQQALRRFEMEYPFESLPIASPLVMFFQNLGAVKLADPMYSWICPTLPYPIGTPANTNGIFGSSDNIMLPNVPALIRFLYEIGTANTINDVTQNNFLVPSSRAAGNANFFGINLGLAQQNQPDFQRLVYSAGWLNPPEIPSTLDARLLRRINRWNLPQLTAATDLQTVSQFLQFDGNLEWFRNLISMCTEEAKFFKGSTKLAVIEPTSGLSSLIETSHSEQTAPTAADLIYPFNSANFPSDLWRFNILTTRGETNQDEIRIGATSQFLVTNFGNLVPNQHASPDPLLEGPYFDPALGARQVDQIESSKTRTPWLAFEQIIRSNLYDETGKQSST